MARSTNHYWNGVELSHVEEHDGKSLDTLRSMHEWEVLGGRCGQCGRVAWMDRKALFAKIGNEYLLNVGRHLKCACGNKEGNRVLIGSISRNA